MLGRCLTPAARIPLIFRCRLSNVFSALSRLRLESLADIEVLVFAVEAELEAMDRERVGAHRRELC